MKASLKPRGLQGKLLDRSIEAYILSLETINRLSITYRVETFTYLICNAWELLLKAEIIRRTGSRHTIYYKRKRGETRRSWELKRCLKTVFADEHVPTRRNVERIEQLRDEATHLVIKRVPRDVLSLFQACVLNFHHQLRAWYGMSLSDRVTVGMMTLVYDFGPDQYDLSHPVMRRELGRETASYLSRFQAEIRKEFASLGKPAEFSIDISYRLMLTQKQGDSDIALTKGEIGEITHVVEVARDPGKTHPYRQKELIEQVNQALGGATRINSHDVQCIVAVYRIKKRPDYYFKGAVTGSPVQYSHRFVDWIANEYAKDHAFFAKTRNAAKPRTP